MEELPEPGEEAAEPVSAMGAAGERISVHNFCGRLSEQLVHFHAMRLRDSLFLWVGEEPKLGNLAVAMCTPRAGNGKGAMVLPDLERTCAEKSFPGLKSGFFSFSPEKHAEALMMDSIPASTLLFGDSSSSTSNSLAQKLASKTRKQIFVSYNIQNTDSSFTLLVENRIKEEMAIFPDKF